MCNPLGTHIKTAQRAVTEIVGCAVALVTANSTKKKKKKPVNHTSPTRLKKKTCSWAATEGKRKQPTAKPTTKLLSKTESRVKEPLRFKKKNLQLGGHGR